MAEIFGHRWTSSYGDDAATGAGETWARGLGGLSSAQIGEGLERVLVSAEDWPPTLPEFRRLCLGIPSLAAVSRALCRHEGERSGFDRLVWAMLDSYAFARADQQRAERMLRDAYVLAREHVMAGGEVPGPVQYLEQAAQERPTPASPETVRHHLDEIAKILGAAPDLREREPEGLERVGSMNIEIGEESL